MKKVGRLFAEIVSRVFDPVWEIPVGILLAVVFAVKEGLRWRFLGLILFIDAVVPFIFFVLMLYHKQISNWDMQKRSERIPIYLFTLLCHMAGLWLAHELGKTELVNVLLVFYAVGVVFAAVTMRWKISLHTGVNAAIVTVVNMFYGWQYFWLYAILLLVAWARVYQKHHSWAQVAVGMGVGAGLTGLGLAIVGV